VPLSAGARLGPYEIVSPLGAGGMGEVYRATDTRLDRTVAIKILPSHLSENPEAKLRFDREARTISSLNHPNICTLHDVGHQDGMDYLVMECLEGETLAARLRRGPLPMDQLLRYAIELCDGLEKAHRMGIVHRDLKPGNIMLTKSGAKLMDFGLAKATIVSVDSTSGLTATVLSPDPHHPVTAQGSVIGTFNYMSPEQVEGVEAGPRSDIFSLGTVLYEMATGKRAFEGATAASALAAVLERDPAPISSISPAVPPAFERLVKSCLAKDPDERWQTVHDVKLQLRQIQEGGSQITATSPAIVRRRRYSSAGWIAAAILTLLLPTAIALTWLHFNKPLPILRVEINPPDNAAFNLSGDDSGPAALSPDGHYLVFSAISAGVSHLYIRPLDSLQARALPGTAGATFPFWSPDSRSVAFFLPDRLMRVEISGGTPITVCLATLARGGSWGPDGTIIAALVYNSGISRVPASGGTPTEITHADQVTYSSHRWPWFLPDGKHFLYVAVNHDNPVGPTTAVFYASLDGKENRLLVHTLSSAIYASGHLLFLHDSSLLAQPLDPDTGKLSGDPEVLSETVQYDSTLWRTNVSASTNGLLAYASSDTGAGLKKIAWYDRTGKLLDAISEPAHYLGIALSPDNKKLAINIQGAADQLWVYDFASKQQVRLNYEPGTEYGPTWSPDSTRVAYICSQGANICAAQVGSGSSVETLLRTQGQVLSAAASWSPDGKFLLYTAGNGLDQRIWVLPLTGDRKPYRYTNNSGSILEFFPKFSPDGRWVAYTASEQNQPFVFVSPFPWTGAKWQVSPAAANQDVWRPDGKALFFYNYSGLLEAQVDGSGPQFEVGASKQLFPITLQGIGDDLAPSRDGQRFLAVTAVDSGIQPLTLVQNWPAELKAK
jgi:serine/threonine protein kinase